MHAETFGLMSVIGFGVSAVLAIAAAVYGVTHHVRAVRDELTGRAAARAIEAMRAGHPSARIPFAPHGEVRPGVQSGSLHLRRASGTLGGASAEGGVTAPTEPRPAAPSTTPAAREPVAAPAVSAAPAAPGSSDSEAGTTLLDGTSLNEDAAQPFLEADAELPPVPEVDSEAGTTLLDGTALHGASGPIASSEAGTTLLDGPAGHAPVAVPSEDATTLLGNEEA